MTEKLSLTELQQVIRDSLYMALPDFYWVVAEISEIKENQSGHCYLELIEKNSDEKNVSARIKAIIWNKRYRFLKSFFENITGESLCEGLKILVKTKIEYHELYGLSLIISDIDPAFTIGEMAMKRLAIIKRLEQEGVFSMNKELGLSGGISLYAENMFEDNYEFWNEAYATVTVQYNIVFQGAGTGDNQHRQSMFGTAGN